MKGGTHRERLAILPVIQCIKLYNAVVVFLAATWGLVTGSYIMVEAGFKVAVVLLATISFEYLFLMDIWRGVGIVLLTALSIPMFYLIHIDHMYIGMALYIILSILIVTTLRDRGKISTMLEDLPLYYVITAFFWVTRFDSSISLLSPELFAIAIASLLFTVTRVAGLKPTLQLSIDTRLTSIAVRLMKWFGRGDTKNRGVSTWLRSRVESILQVVAKGPSSSNTIQLRNALITILNLVSRTENTLATISKKAVEYIHHLAKKFATVERKLLKTSHEISIAVEKLQHSMEHSFLLLLFLVGILTLIAIIFYIMFVAVAKL